MRVSNTDCNPIAGYTWASDTKWLGEARYISKIKTMDADQLRTEIRELKAVMSSLDVTKMERDIAAKRSVSANKLAVIITYLRSLL